MSQRICCIALFLVVSGCVGGTSQDFSDIATNTQPLIGGAPVSGSAPATVAIQGGNLSLFCSGTLVSPSVVLTAAHCLDLAGGDPNLSVFFGDDFNSPGVRVATNGGFKHINWTGAAGRFDVGMLLLTFPQLDVTPIPLNTVDVDTLIGTDYRIVGFGRKNPDDGVIDGLKREGLVQIAQTRNDVLETDDATVWVCYGDSGGSGFITLDGVEYVAGIHSYTYGDDCHGPHGATRVDLYADLINDWIQENDPVCQMDGLCVPEYCTDDPDCLPCNADGTCTADCPLPDPDCPTSDVGEICRADSQCMNDDVCIVVSSFPDSRFCTGECDPGNDTCPDGMSCQNITGLGNVCYFDEQPPFVLGSACEIATDCGTYICEQNVCTKPCDLSMNQGCPGSFACRDDEGDGQYFCMPPPKQDGGGCDSGTGGGLLILLLIGTLAATLRQGRSRQTAAVPGYENT